MAGWNSGLAADVFGGDPGGWVTVVAILAVGVG